MSLNKKVNQWVFKFKNEDEYIITGNNIMFMMDSESEEITEIHVYRDNHPIFFVHKDELVYWCEKRYLDNVN